MRHVGHQDIVDPVKELLQIKFHAPAVTRRNMGTRCFDGFVSAFARTKAVTVVRKQRVEDRRELVQKCLLDHAVHDAEDTQLSGAAFRSRNVRRTYTCGRYSPANSRLRSAVMPSAIGAPLLLTTH